MTPPADPLYAAREAVAARMAELTTERDTLTARLDELETVLQRLTALGRTAAAAAPAPAAAPDDSPPETRPAPVPAGKARPPVGPDAGDPDARRRTLARLIRDRGPLGFDAIQTALSWSAGATNKALQHPWFSKTGESKRSPWGLTPAGRAALNADTGATHPTPRGDG